MILDRSGHSDADSYRVRSLREQLRQVVGIEPSDQQLRNRQDVHDAIVELERALRLMQEVRDILKDEDKVRQALRHHNLIQAAIVFGRCFCDLHSLVPCLDYLPGIVPLCIYSQTHPLSLSRETTAALDSTS